jgi:class 3 adenylate cyclase/tetratricopeptide (TPR) repeat protein
MSDQPAPRPRRNLASLFDSLEEPKVDALRDLARQAPVSPTPDDSPRQFIPRKKTIRLAPELQDYLPPDLWRKLNSDSPRSGIYINALERLNSLLYSISTYLPADLVQEKLARPIPGLVDGKILRGCLLFSDVSGFTALSERLATLGPAGAEHLTGFINQYFTAMIDIISWSNGILVKFAGDATLIYFPEQENGDHTRWAARAGLRMLRAMSDFKDIATPLGPVSLSMKLGLAAGKFLAASIGSPKRMEYALVGETVAQTLGAEGNSASGLLVVNQEAADTLREGYQLAEVKPGFFSLAPGPDADLDSFEIRPASRRARSGMPWDADIEELSAEVDNVLGKIRALAPYLPGELLDRIVSHASQRQVGSEYRPTAVMFCNFTGPETLLDQWGDSGAQRVTGLLSAYFNDMNEAISRFGGIVSRIDPYSKGTKLLALFGAPVAHEDDPQRAVSAALAMNSALLALNRRWAQKLARHLPPGASGELIQHRIGITIGETFAGQAGSATRREYTVMGDEVNLAARLMSTAEPGQILISEAVLERVKAYYVTRKLPPVRVKGKKQPIPIFQVDGPREDTLLSRIEARDTLIGRQAEFDQAWQFFENARGEDHALLALSGPAGLGKSHLADALLKHALQNGWQVEAFQCRSYQAEEAQSCWVGLLRLLAGMTPLDHPLIQAEKLERLTTELDLARDQHSTLTDLLGLRQAQIDRQDETLTVGDDLFNMVKERRASRKSSNLDVFEQLEGVRAKAPSDTSPLPNRQTAREQSALQAVLAALSARAPLAIFFEDSHWMDDTSRETLLALSQKLSAAPIAFLLAGRPHEGLPENIPLIKIRPFSLAETSAMAAAILTEGLTEIIHQQSNGSPLFVEEISRWIKRTHSIDQAGLKSVLQSSDILQKLVLSSLESLPEKQRELARLASVVGMEFRRSEIEALLEGQADTVSLSNNLHSLAQSHLVDLSEASVDPRYTFEQVIFRDVLYTSLPFERRRELHARLAEHLKTRPTQRRQLRDKIAAFLQEAPAANPLREVETLAYHLEMSENWLEAAQQWNNAAGLLPPEGAGIELPFGKALAVLERIPPEAASDPKVGLQKARAHSGLAWLSLAQGELPAAAAASQAALQAAPLTALPPETSTRLAATLALCWPSQGKTAQAQKELAEYLESQPDLPNPWRFEALQIWLAWRAGSDPASLAAAALEKIPEDQSDAPRRARALLDDLSRRWEQAAPVYQSVNAVDCAALTFLRCGDSLLAQRKPDAAGEHYQRAYETWQKAGTACGLALATYRRAELTQANPHASLSLLEESLAWLEKSPPALQTGPRAIVQNALARLKKRQPGPWGAWHWQPFEDLAYINLLMPVF